MEKEEWLEFFRTIYTQQQQQIDILMMLLYNANNYDGQLVDFAHNKKNVFLSDLSAEEYEALATEFGQKHDPS